MKTLGAKDLLERAALATDTVEIPGGGAVRVRELSVAQRAEFAKLASNGSAGLLSAYLAAAACVDDDGKTLFSDQKELYGVSPRIVDAISKAVLRLSGMGEDKAEADEEG